MRLLNILRLSCTQVINAKEIVKSNQSSSKHHITVYEGVCMSHLYTLFHSCELLKMELECIDKNSDHQEIRFLGVQLKATYELTDAAAMFLQIPPRNLHDLRRALSHVKHVYEAIENYLNHVDAIITE